LSRERVLEAALALVDEEGLESLSMRRLGEALGVQAMSLYRHVAGKDDLLDGVQGAVLAEMEHPRVNGSLAERATAWSRALRGALMRHPKTIPLFSSRPVTDVVALRQVEAALASLTEAGASDQEALGLYQTMLAFVIGSAVLELTPRAPVAMSSEALDDPHLPTLRRLAAVGRQLSPEAEFEAGLAILAAGVAARAQG
jgi:AcrR family transcriptional regulator